MTGRAPWPRARLRRIACGLGTWACVWACSAVLAQPLAPAADAVPAPAPATIDRRPTTTPQPKWELGLGLAGLQLPHYRGSDQRYGLLLPVPYGIYRGDILRADRDGTRAMLLDADAVQIDVSLAGGNPTRSKDNQARSGMPNLAPTLEIGPKLSWTLLRRAGHKLDFQLPVRAVLAVSRQPRQVGWTATPHLNLDLPPVAGWKVGLRTAVQLADRGYHGYVYDVTDAQTTTSRPAYRAGGGYSGFDALVAVSRRTDGGWMGAFLRWDNLAGARIADSPLVRQRQNWSAGFAASWVLVKSDEMVDWPR